MADLAGVRDVLSLAADPYEAPFNIDEQRAISDVFGKHWLNAGGFSLESATLTATDDDYCADSAEDVVASQQEAGIVRAALDGLSERQRAVAVLRYGFTELGALSQAETADILGCSQPNIVKLERAAVRSLRKILASMPEGLELIATRMIESGRA